MGVIGRIVSAVLIVVAATSCGGDTQEPASSQAESVGQAGSVGDASSAVSVVLDDYTLEPDRSSVPSGVVNFEIREVPSADRPHQFAVYRTDLPPDRPLSVDNIHVDVAHEELEVVAFLSDTTVTPQTLRTELAAGKYALVCNSEDHYLKGMWAAFRVT